MRLSALAASLSVLLSQACLAEDFSIFSVDNTAAMPQINLAIDRDSISHQNDRIAYVIRWYDPYANKRESESIVANCETRQRGPWDSSDTADTVSLYSVYPDTMMAMELDIVCGVRPSPDLSPIAEVPNTSVAQNAPRDATTPEEIDTAYRTALHGSATALDTLKRAAEYGHAQAQLDLGYLHLSRSGPNYNPIEAAKWFAAAVPDLRERANRGEVGAQYELARLYFNGNGVTANKMEAIALLRKASEQGHVLAKIQLARMYSEAETPGIKPALQDYPAAFKLSQQAAKTGNAEAQYLLASLYESGHGVTQNNTEALAWYRKAAGSGNLAAEYKTGMAYLKGDMGAKQDYVEAAKWLMPAARQGNADAAFQIGMLYYKGLGLEQDDAEAADWIRKVAEHGSPKEAQAQLAQMYREGRGVPKDAAEAQKWQALADQPMQVIANLPRVAPETSSPQVNVTMDNAGKADNANKTSKAATMSLDNCKPEYPRTAVNANETGTVRVSFTVGADDQLMSSDVVSSSGFLDLDQAALTRLSLCKFKTARTIDDKPVQSTFTIDYVWKIAD